MITSDFYRVAKKELDEGEVSGNQANPRIVQYLQSTSLSGNLNATDETPWCSAFVNWVVEKAGMKGTDRADAVSWLNWGEKTDKPQKGSIVIFQWPDGGHHVGFVNGFDQEGKVSVLGGNQSNSVKISEYNKSSVIGYRNPPHNFFSRWLVVGGIITAIAAATTGLIFYFTNRKKK